MNEKLTANSRPHAFWHDKCPPLSPVPKVTSVDEQNVLAGFNKVGSEDVPAQRTRAGNEERLTRLGTDDLNVCCHVTLAIGQT